MGNVPSAHALLAGAAPGSLAGKSFLITGANTGIGLETARALADGGAQVFIACRNREKGERAVAQLREQCDNEHIRFLQLDLGSLASVQACAEHFLSLDQPLHCLINNAGVAWLPKFERTSDGIEMQWGVNHLGHFYLTALLLPKLRQSSPSRVVNVASRAHRTAWGFQMAWLPPQEKKYNAFRAYGVSKLSNMLHAAELHRRETGLGSGVSAFSLHPGVIATELAQHHSLASLLYRFVIPWTTGISTEQGAATTVFCATAASPADSGKYFSKCQVEPPKLAAALDPGNAQRLWDLSSEILRFKGHPVEADELV